MKVGFIGLGMMGSGMARNLIKAGHALVVFNRTRSRAQELAQLGATVAATPGEAAGSAEVLITMLADDHALEDAILGPGRALQSLPAGAIHVGMSTISVAMSRRLQAAHHERQQHYVAAPVFGRPEAAEAAKLFIVVAGPRGTNPTLPGAFRRHGAENFCGRRECASGERGQADGKFPDFHCNREHGGSSVTGAEIRSRSEQIPRRAHRFVVFGAHL